MAALTETETPQDKERYGYPWIPERRYPVEPIPNRDLTPEEQQILREAQVNEHPLLERIVQKLDEFTPEIVAFSLAIRLP